jgi:hypothetical protein
MSFKDAFERRREEHRSSPAASWVTLVKRLLLLVVVIALMRILGSPKGGKLTSFVFGKSKTEQVQQERP